MMNSSRFDKKMEDNIIKDIRNLLSLKRENKKTKRNRLYWN